MTLIAPMAHADGAAGAFGGTIAGRADRSAVPRLLSAEARATYQALFAAIHHQDWATVQALLAQTADAAKDDPLHAVARAEYYLASGSPRIDLATLEQWLTTGADLPEAEAIATLAQKRGATSLPPLPQPQALVSLPASPRRSLPRTVNDGTMPAATAGAILAAIKADDPHGARALLDGVDAGLSSEARAEWRQRLAWSYYIENDPADAYAMALSAARGDPLPGPLPGVVPAASVSASVAGAWVGEAWWTAGLAAWRAGDCAAAGAAFAATAQDAVNPELAAAGYYWQARAAVRCRRPDVAATLLRAAAGYDETMYGMLASEALGLRAPPNRPTPDLTAADWRVLREHDSIRAAVALAEIGEDGLADTMLRHQARIGDAALFPPLARLARDLGLAGTQLWLAYNAPAGGVAMPIGRYPMPKWAPANGWQIDPALVLAHSLEESRFRTGAVSPAGARGLMQLRPATAHASAGALGLAGSDAELARPEVNLALGQAHLASLRDSTVTGGLLPKVIAAYNAGLQPVSRWNSAVQDGGDPLLWMESLPYWETRGYVTTVLRNYWMYERQAGGGSQSRVALAEGLWPAFPGLAQAKAARLAQGD